MCSEPGRDFKETGHGLLDCILRYWNNDFATARGDWKERVLLKANLLPGSRGVETKI